MTGRILVPLERGDRIEDLIPYLEELAKPGMRVVFLISYPVESRLYLRDHWVTTESIKEAMMAGRRIMHRYSWEVQKELAEQRVSPAREALCKMEMEVTVDVYAGSLRKVIGEYKANGDLHLIMERVRGGHPIMRLLSWIPALFGRLDRPRLSPVLLLHPDHGVQG